MLQRQHLHHAELTDCRGLRCAGGGMRGLLEPRRFFLSKWNVHRGVRDRELCQRLLLRNNMPARRLHLRLWCKRGGMPGLREWREL